MTDLPARYRHKWLILAICCMSLLVVSMDATVVNVALPSIGRDLKSTISGLQWTVDAYTLVLASLLLLSGFTADKIGRRRTFQIGLVIFTTGSLLCSIAPSIETLVVFRMVQAVGGSMLNPVAMSIITATFDDPKQRARAVGAWAAVVGISLGLGPVVGGLLTDTVGWRSIFWINIPIGVAAIVLTAVFVPESRGNAKRRFDPLGQVLVIVFLGSVVAGLIEGGRLGWGSLGTIGLFVLSAVALALFIWHASRAAHPFVNLDFFRSLPFVSALLTAVLVFSVQAGFLFLAALYLQDVRGLSPFQAGLRTIPLAVLQLIAAPISGRLVSAGRLRTPTLTGAAAILVATAGLTVLSTTTPYPLLLTLFAVLGLGLGLMNPPITTTAVSGMPRSQSGSAAALASTGRQIGVSLGVALAGTITGVGGASAVGKSFPAATHAVWFVFAAFAVGVGLLNVLARSRWGQATTKSVAHLMGDGDDPGSTDSDARGGNGNGSSDAGGGSDAGGSSDADAGSDADSSSDDDSKAEVGTARHRRTAGAHVRA